MTARWSGCPGLGYRRVAPAGLKPGSPLDRLKVSSANLNIERCWHLHREGHLHSGSLVGKKRTEESLLTNLIKSATTFINYLIIAAICEPFMVNTKEIRLLQHLLLQRAFPICQ